MNIKAEISDQELDLLKKLVGHNKVIIELGSYAGKVTSALAENNIVIAIDPLIGGYDSRDEASKSMEGVEDVFKSRIKDKNVIWYKKRGEEVLKFWKMMVDGVFIDAEHTTKALNVDVNWVKHIRDGGIIAFHDYHPSWKEVVDFIDKKIQAKYQEIARIERLIVFRK